MLKIKTLLIILLISIVGMAGCKLDSALDAPETAGDSPDISKACVLSVDWIDSDNIYYWPRCIGQELQQIPYPEPGYIKKYFYYTVTNTCGIPVSVELDAYDNNAFYIYHNRASKYVRIMLKSPVIRNR